MTTAFDSCCSLQAFGEVCRSCAGQATKCQYTELELYPLGDTQPMQVIEKPSDVIRPSRRESQPSCSVQNRLEPVKEMTGDTGQHRTAVVDFADNEGPDEALLRKRNASITKYAKNAKT